MDTVNSTIDVEAGKELSFIAGQSRPLSLSGEKGLFHIISFAVGLMPQSNEARATLIDVKSGRGRAEIVLERAGTMAMRLQNEVLCVGNERGR